MKPSKNEGFQKLAGILFLDVKDFSKLNQLQLEKYIKDVLPELAQIINSYNNQLLDINTWGDGVIVVMDDPVILARLALDFRDYFRRTNFESKGLHSNLQTRISLHVGTVYYGHDPIRQRNGIIGSSISLAARIEPIIVPGEVWVTEEFEKVVASHAAFEKIAFDNLGEKQLAKGYGSHKLLRLRRVDELATLAPITDRAIRAGLKLSQFKTSYDIVGIGALNTDFIASATNLAKVKTDLIAEQEQFFEFGKERPATEWEVKKVINLIGRHILVPSLGGSTFNTIHALARAVPDLKLAYIGVAGNSDAELGFIDILNALNVDTNLIEDSSSESGICVSYISRGERSLLTYPGANVSIADHFRKYKEDIINTLGRSKLVHITSLFDEESPAILAQILREAIDKNPWLQISFDPGHDWVRRIKSRQNADPIIEIMNLSTYLFLNQIEFEILSDDTGIKEDLELAQDIFHYLSSQTILILLKRYDEIRIFHRIQKKLKEIRFLNEPLVISQIEDATGAGDVFAAGLFIAIFIPGLELKDGISLGLRLAKKKLAAIGASDFNSFQRIVEEYIDGIYLNR